ncbi:TraB/GumN family protein [Luteimonas fraxinea]|uniref:TraB/GumN family protein n=1 Tax=Luteimonas fraxinea TaxID=2901869 RepID=UPI001E580D16|nr:TraB/GumN family protein [Luteimonas fraxinea]MCD9124729.1 TraB/GumN family protein [Luteimonas fraxinea]
MDKRFGVGLLAFAMASASMAPTTQAQEAPAASPAPAAQSDTPDVRDMDTVVVTGVQPGPGLWRVRRDDGHTLYILGTQSPLPAGITWRADEVREVLAEAGVALGPPGAQWGADIGFFNKLTLAPSAFRAMRNPDGATLDELLPPDLYARWVALKERYIGRDRGIERKRPFIAVYQLYRAALERNGLREGGIIGPVIEDALKARGMELTPTILQLKIDDPRGALATFRRETLKPEDIACVRGTLDIIENDLPRIAARANAWAVGDLDTLRGMPDARAQVMTCLSAWTASETARELGMADIQSKVSAAWLSKVDAAMAEHPVVFATVPIDSLLRADGQLDALRARGYTVLAPDESDVVEDVDGDASKGAVTP